MSPAFGRSGHDRARELAAQRVDEALASDDAAWLDAHLAGCATCRADAEGFAADRLLFAPLRAAPPVPPRDLWARTAASIDAEAAPGRGRSGARGPRLTALVPLAGLAAVAVVASSVLLTDGTLVPAPSGPAATAMALQPGQVAVITRGPDGGLAFVTADVDEVCPVAADDCIAAAPSFETSGSAAFAASDDVDAILSPGRDRVVLVQRTATGTDGVFVIPVTAAGAASVTPTPEPTDASTDRPTPTPDGATTPPPSDGPADSEPPATPSPTEEPTDERTPGPTDEPSVSPEATPSPEPTEEPTPDATPTVEITPTADGAIEIASDVVVVGTAAYNEDGSRFAFSARPADGSAGPDVYVWDTSEARARAVTDDHASVLAGWHGNDLLVSRVVDGQPSTVVLDAKSGDVGEALGAAWLPTVSPDGSTAAWWDGSITLDDDGVTWVPDKGRLVVGRWPDGLADPDSLQVIERGTIRDWEVRWDPAGRAIAAWTTGPDGGKVGRLGLYELENGTGRARLATPLFEDASAFGGFSLDRSQLVYAGTDGDKDRSLWVVAWDDDGVGRLPLPDDALVIR